MAREPMKVEVVQPPLGAEPKRRVANGPDVWEAELYPGSRSEKVQRLGEAAWAVAEADAEGAKHPSAAVVKRWEAAVDEYEAALAALRQHDTEHGRMG